MTDPSSTISDKPTPLRAELAASLEQAGIQHALAPAGVVASLRDEVLGVRDRGLLAESLFDSYQEYWRFVAPDGVAEPRTLIVVAWQSLPLKIRFQLAEGPLDAVVPPTYISAQGRARCLEVVRSVLGPAGHSVGWARVPVKLLSARTGLTRYGRNNIAYAPVLGSYVRLGALCTDADLGATGWDMPGAGDAGLQFLDQCTYCHACQRACPTGCIPEDGTVIDAARCLTEANENEGDWPPWIPAESHNSLVGCMRCQEACPVDRAYLGREAALIAEFDRDETELILKGPAADDLPARLKTRLATVELDEYLPVLGRNLRALIDAAAIRSAR
jgi:epoxyqueuosine reductase